MITALLLVLAGCSGNPEDTDPVDTNPPPFGSDTGYGVPTGEGPALELSEIEGALVEGVALFRELDPVELLDAVDALLALGDTEGDCPGGSDQPNDFTGYEAECAAESGAEFYLDLKWRRQVWEPGSGTNPFAENATINGGWKLVDLGGDAMDFSLLFAHDDKLSSGGARTLSGLWFGRSIWSGAPAGHWLEAGPSFSLEYAWYTEPDGTTPVAFTAAGGVSQLTGETVETIELRGEFGVEYAPGVYGFSVSTPEAGGACPAEPHGSIHLRTQVGEWYVLEFDAPPFGETMENSADCDGCGTVSFRGEDLGSICPDFSIFLDWEARPW